MGWCHEFGTQVNVGCEHPMTAGPEACHCDVCGFVCTGKFSGCAEVWARGPRPITLLRRPEPPGQSHRRTTLVEEAPLDDRLGRPSEEVTGTGSEETTGLPGPDSAAWTS